jgi:hypothetical protein
MGNQRPPEGKDRGKAPANNDSDSDEAVAPAVRAPVKNSEELKNACGVCVEMYQGFIRTKER